MSIVAEGMGGADDEDDPVAALLRDLDAEAARWEELVERAESDVVRVSSDAVELEATLAGRLQVLWIAQEIVDAGASVVESVVNEGLGLLREQVWAASDGLAAEFGLEYDDGEQGAS